MKAAFLVLSFCLAGVPALAQSLAPTPQELRLESDLAIQKSAAATQQSLDQQRMSLIEQQQRRQELFNANPFALGPPPAFAPVPQPAFTPPR